MRKEHHLWVGINITGLRYNINKVFYLSMIYFKKVLYYNLDPNIKAKVYFCID